MQRFDITATTFFGLENVLADEIKAIDGQDIQILNRAVLFSGTKETLYKANLWLRTALKVLVPIAKFYADNEDILYQRIKHINWSKYLTENKTFAIDSVVSSNIFTHSKYVALKSKDAIADYFKEKKGIRPNVDVENPDLRINIHVFNDNITISLDSTGTPMSKRGYKLKQTAAPLNEVLAAGMLKLSGWDGNQSLIDPMCGSGTIPIEATLMALNIAPGSFRKFAFEKWVDFDSNLWKTIKQESHKLINKGKKIEISGYDIDPTALDVATYNAKNAKVEHIIDFNRKDFLRNPAMFRNQFVIMNPPYGERLEDSQTISAFYKQIGDRLKASYSDCQAWIISGNIEAIKHIGLHPSKKIKLFNGPIECKFLRYELYSGSKKQKKQNINEQ